MKLIVSFLFLLYTLTSYSQEIKYKAVFYDQCWNSYTPIIFARIYKDTVLIGKIDFNNQSIILKDTGSYSIELFNNFELDVIPIYFSNFEDKIDTFNLKSITHNNMVFCDPVPCNFYHTCSPETEGWKIDYYHNGQIRTKGYFINIGDDKNMIPRKYIKSYYSNGQLAEFSNFKSNSSKSKCHLKYYENGNIKYKWKKFNRKGVEFYENGNKKSKLRWGLFKLDKEYYSNGKISCKKTRKWEYKFDESGNRISKEKLELSRRLIRKQVRKIKRMY